MGEILGPDGKPVDGLLGVIAVPPGQAVDINVVDETKLAVDGVRILLEPGRWRIIPALLWQSMVVELAQLRTERTAIQAALHLEEDEVPTKISRQVRRRILRDLRN